MRSNNIRQFNRSLLLILLAVLYGLAGAAHAQPMADQLPATTLIYSGWSPSAALQDTLPAHMLADDRLVRPWKAVVASYLEAAPVAVTHGITGGSGADEAQEMRGVVAEHLEKLLADAAKCEGCFALLEIKRTPDGAPNPQAVLMLNLGAKRADFESHFKPIHEHFKQMLGDSVHMLKIQKSWLWSKTENDHDEYFWGFIGDRFVFYYGDGGEAFLRAMAKDKPEKPLATAERFTDCLGKIPGSAVMTTYADVPPLLAIARDYFDLDDPQVAGADKWAQRIKRLGLDNVKALGEKTSIEDQQFVTRTLLRTDGAPHGVLPALIQPAVDDALLKCVPQEAWAAFSIRVEPGKAYEQLKIVAGAMSGGTPVAELEDLEKEAKDAGLPVQDLLASLGDQWVLYNSNSTGGMFLTGWTLVGTLKDVDGFNREMDKFSKLYQDQKDGQTPAHSGQPGPGSVRGQYVVDGQTIHYLVQDRRFIGPFTSPAWAQVGDKVVIGIFPQIVEAAVKQISAEKSLLDSPGFQASRKLTGHEGPMVYIAGQRMVKEIYPIGLVLAQFGVWPHGWPGVGGDANGQGDMPPELIPPMDRLLQYVGDDAATMKVTPDGILRTKCIANPLLSPFTLIDNVPLMAALSLPWMHGGQ